MRYKMKLGVQQELNSKVVRKYLQSCSEETCKPCHWFFTLEKIGQYLAVRKGLRMIWRQSLVLSVFAE